ncbi:type II toxin-antitoxin system HipA family toxin [Pigmentiphaga aceris]|uniref:Type II toxin-antitoxin system HipA family toxin n=1 Tax=Pigmentiphaga aceris TaxID=1940612 RepID=A0A5C0B6M4_9BURK|nr:type II toxin-antitoxin system HipA family toxin [Pigmentiphaga aceris]
MGASRRTTISRSQFVYLQRPDTGVWVTVGRYTLNDDASSGSFVYAPSYLESDSPWAIDPVNLPLLSGIRQPAPRYRGLHDVLRDAGPDSWGQLLLQRVHGLGDDTHIFDYLRLAGNGDRWGALALGPGRTPPSIQLKSPTLPQLPLLAQELQAIHERRPAEDMRVRRMLMTTTSLGGARPKGTLRDGDAYWLVKPLLQTDVVDIPQLEHAAMSWGTALGIRMALTVHHQIDEGLSVLRIRRFDREGEQRHMAISGASLLAVEYPGGLRDGFSYPRLAEELRRIGTPVEDRHELFDRMVFNALAGNDDDHPRNHAAVWQQDEGRWRLSPAFDVVPNPELVPTALSMQLSKGHFDISRDSVLADAVRFGFTDTASAAARLDAIIEKAGDTLPSIEDNLPASLSTLMRERFEATRAALKA